MNFATRALLELHTGLFPAGNPFALDADAVTQRAVGARGGARVERLEVGGFTDGIDPRYLLSDLGETDNNIRAVKIER